MSLLKAIDVTVIYKSVSKINKVVDKVSFDVKKGDYLCIIGSNGSGKSSLMKALLGLVPISFGNVCFKISKDKISYLSQVNEVSRELPATVYEIVLSGLQNPFSFFSFYNKFDYEKAHEALKLVKLEDVKNKKFGELSIGQQQRVLLARSLSKNPEFIFLDEPCTNLDEYTTNQFYDVLETLNKDLKISIVMISHDSSQVEKYATHVLHLNKKVLFYDTISKWLSVSKNVRCMH